MKQIIRFTVGLLGRFGKVIPTSFTLCSVTRYTGTVGIGEPRGRILQTKEINCLHGHWSARINVVHYDKWVTGHGADAPPTNMEWVVLCGTNGAQRVYLGVGDEAKNIATAHAGPLSQDNTLVINAGAIDERSAFACMEVITWNRALSDAEMVTLVFVLVVA